MNIIPTRLPIHFDIPYHHLKADNYLVAINAFQDIFEEFNKHLFKEGIDYEIVVLPSEKGCFKGAIGIIVKSFAFAGVLSAFATLADSHSANRFLYGLTGQHIDFGDSMEEAGKFLRNIAINFFTTETEELEKCIPSEINLDGAFHAKSTFYLMCQENRDIAAIGFSDTEEFPIKRQEFQKHISKNRIRPLDSDFVLYDAIIVSPIDIDVDQIWRFKDKTTGHAINAYMRDESFRKGFLQGKYPLKKSYKDDYVTILVEYKKHSKNGKTETREISVHTVYKFNEMDILPLPEWHANEVNYSNRRKLPMDSLWS